MKYRTENKNNEELLNGISDNPDIDGTVGDFVSAITIDSQFKGTGDAYLAADSLNRVLAFVEYGLSTHMNKPRCSEETILDGVAEIIRACRLVSLRIEDCVYEKHMHEEEKKLKEKQNLRGRQDHNN